MTVLLVVVLWLVAEVAVLVAVAEAIGILPAVVLLLAVSATGPWLVRRVGLGVWRRTRERMQAGQPPGAEALDGMALVVGGLLVTIPGFIGDVVGLAILAPPVRALVRKLIARRFSTSIVGAVAGRRRRSVIDVDSHPGGADRPEPGDPPGGPFLDPPR